MTPSPPLEGKKGLARETTCDMPKNVAGADKKISETKENSCPNTSEKETPSKHASTAGDIHKSTFEAASALMTLFCKLP